MERQNEASLAGKVAIVTGSSRGIGKRAAIALARRGARLIVTARTVEASGSELPGTIGETVKEIEAAGGEAVAVAADLSDERDLEMTDKAGGKVAETREIELSADGRTLTMIIRATGRDDQDVLVFERE